MARTKTIKKITKKTIMCVKCGMITDSYEKQFPKQIVLYMLDMKAIYRFVKHV